MSVERMKGKDEREKGSEAEVGKGFALGIGKNVEVESLYDYPRTPTHRIQQGGVSPHFIKYTAHLHRVCTALYTVWLPRVRALGV